MLLLNGIIGTVVDLLHGSFRKCMFSYCFAGRAAMQLCADPHIVNFLSKTFHISTESPNKKCQQVCTMLERQTIFTWAMSPNDTEKLFSKLQVSAVCL